MVCRKSSVLRCLLWCCQRGYRHLHSSSNLPRTHIHTHRHESNRSLDDTTALVRGRFMSDDNSICTQWHEVRTRSTTPRRFCSATDVSVKCPTVGEPCAEQSDGLYYLLELGSFTVVRRSIHPYFIFTTTDEPCDCCDCSDYFDTTSY